MREFESELPEHIYTTLYKRFTHLHRFTPLSFDFVKVDQKNKIAVLSVRQTSKLTDELYTGKEMADFSRSFVSILEKEGWTVHINAKVFVAENQFSEISAAWIISKMQDYGISINRMAKDLGVDRFVISKILDNKIGLTRWHKAAFYYYFNSLSLDL